MRFLVVFAAFLLASTTLAAAVTKVHRKNNLDYLNAETLQYFLSHPASLEYDAIVMFYANWDQHSHSFANIYAQIASLLKAGSQDSKLILGLFDCEADATHMQLCTKAGITHYPTTLYFSFATGRQYKFGGNWAYGDAVLDWIKTLRALSGWHRAGWGKRLRTWLFGGAKDVLKPELPLGIPTTSGGNGSSSGGGGTATSDTSAKDLELLNTLQEEKKQMNDLLVRSAAMMEAVLFPYLAYSGPNTTRMRDAHKNYTDLFAYLNETDGWTTMTSEGQVLRSCLQDVALEYCQRFATISSEEFLLQHPEETTDLINLLSQHLQLQEPYCMLLDGCVLSDFVAPKCRPNACPFRDPTACRFLTSCFYESMQQQYAKLLGVELRRNGATANKASATNTTSTSSATPPSSSQDKSQPADSDNYIPKKRSKWGIGG